jgi:hypothetical protein
VVGLVGILSGQSSELLGAGAVMVAAVGYAAGPMIIKRHLLEYDPRATMAASLTVAAVLLTPAGLLTVPDSVPPADALTSLVVLGVLCTAAACRDPDGARRRGRCGPRFDHHLHQPGDSRRSGRDRARGEPGRGAIAGLLLILTGSWLATDDRLPPNPTAIVTRLLRRREPVVSEPSLPVRTV